MNGKTPISVMKIGIKHYMVFPYLVAIGVVFSIFQSLFASDGDFYLSFPLPDYTATTAPISSVFDHSTEYPYCPDQIVCTYTDEKGTIPNYDEKPYSASSKENCPGQNLYSYKKSDETTFYKKGKLNYIGTTLTGSSTLNYDGHPGYDFPAKKNTKVLAAASGTAYLVDNSSYNTVYIDHGNGYKTYYMHLESRAFSENKISVNRGDVIGYSGDKGSPNSYHLHFEVKKNGVSVDPYGWDGNGADPYEEKTGVKNIDLWTSPTSISTITHTLTPPTKIEVSQGGVLEFTVEEKNNSNSYYAYYIQIYVKNPKGITTNSRKISTYLRAGEERQHKYYLFISSSIELGSYTFGVKVIDTSGNLIDNDSFEFTVVSGTSYAIRRSARKLKRLMRNPDAQVVEEDGWKVIVVPERDR